VRWVKMAALLLHGKSSCVDGRDDHGVIGTPGGDAGEFLLALTSIERVDRQAVPGRVHGGCCGRTWTPSGTFTSTRTRTRATT
jgi:hypothetical protein